MKFVTPAACVAVLMLTACEETKAPEPEMLSQLDINSAKRQCVSVAVLQQVPKEAATGICGCTVDELIKSGKFTATARPNDRDQQQVLDKCIDSHAPAE